MNSTYKQLYFNILRIFIGLVFITSGILKLYPVAPLEILLVKINVCNWFWAPIIARILIGFELTLGCLLVLKIFPKKILFLSLITLIGFTIFLLYFKFVLGKDDNCGCFGEAVQLNPVESILKNLLLFSLIVFLIVKIKGPSKPWTKYQHLILTAIFVVGFSLPFVLNAITFSSNEGNYVVKPGMYVSPEKFKGVRFDGDSINLLEGRKLICFLSLKCKTCKYTATKLAVLNREYNNTLPVYIIFLKIKDSEELLKKFMKETEADSIKHTIMEPEQFMKVSDVNLPFLMYLDNGEIKNLSNFDDLQPDSLVAFFKGK